MKQQSWLSINFFAFFFTWGIFLPYWTGWLIFDKNLTVVEASMIISAGLVARSVSTLFLFPALSARFSMAALMKILPLLSLGTLLLFIPFDSVPVLIGVMVVFSLFYPNMMPLMESNASILMRFYPINYGRSRSYGSLGYTVGLLLIGVTTAVWSESSIFAVMVIGVTMMVIAGFLASPNELQEIAVPEKGQFRSLLQSPGFLLVMSICVLIQGAHASYYNFGFIYLQELNVSSIYIGVILNIAIVSEILFFAVADKLFKKTPVASMFIMAGIASVIRWVLIGLFPSLWVFIFTQLFHSLTFGLAHYAFIRYLYRSLTQSLIPSAQGLYASLGMGFSSAILTFAGSYLYEISPGAAFIGMGAAAFPAILLGMILYRKKTV